MSAWTTGGSARSDWQTSSRALTTAGFGGRSRNIAEFDPVDLQFHTARERADFSRYGAAGSTGEAGVDKQRHPSPRPRRRRNLNGGMQAKRIARRHRYLNSSRSKPTGRRGK